VTHTGLTDQQQRTNAYHGPKTDATYILVSFRSSVANELGTATKETSHTQQTKIIPHYETTTAWFIIPCAHCAVSRTSSSNSWAWHSLKNSTWNRWVLNRSFELWPSVSARSPRTATAAFVTLSSLMAQTTAEQGYIIAVRNR